MPPDPWNLRRFVDAQAPVYAGVCRELEAGRKTSHWMWFVFPQLASLGHSPTAKHFGIADAAEAVAYAAHPVLGPRLEHCAALVLKAAGHRTALQMFGTPDNLKLRSSMTLFSRVAPHTIVFAAVLDALFDGRPDPATVAACGPASG